MSKYYGVMSGSHIYSDVRSRFYTPEGRKNQQRLLNKRGYEGTDVYFEKSFMAPHM